MELTETGKVVWKEVPGHPGYDVSNTGAFRSWVYPTRQGVKRRVSPKILRVTPDRKGYTYTFLGRRARKYAHVAVLEAFVGPRPTGFEACHANDVPNDNRLMNLRWGLPSDNRQDARVNGKLCVGSAHPTSKLDEDKVKDGRLLRSQGYSVKEIAQLFGVHPGTMSQACRGTSWKHVSE